MAAIYQWLLADEVVYTTTLYPVFDYGEVQLEIDCAYGYMQPWPDEDYYTQYSEPLSGSVTSILIDTEIIDGDYTQFSEPLSGSLSTILIDTEIIDGEYSQYSEPLSGSVTSKLIRVYSPDHLMQMGLDLETSQCHLTPV